MTEKKFSFPESKNTIKEYEKQQKEEENRIIFIEEGDQLKKFDPEEENKIKEFNSKLKSEKAEYDIHRQMSLMDNEILKKSKSFSFIPKKNN